jgi:uncharacterized FAD-dependent dehydrogenase
MSSTRYEVYDKVLPECFYNSVSQEWPKRTDKASLLTASGMISHAFPSMFVSSLREFLENCANKHDALKTTETVLFNIYTENYYYCQFSLV